MSNSINKFRIVSKMNQYSNYEWFYVEHYIENMIFPYLSCWEYIPDIPAQETYDDALKQLKKHIKYITYESKIVEFDIADLQD